MRRRRRLVVVVLDEKALVEVFKAEGLDTDTLDLLADEPRIRHHADALPIAGREGKNHSPETDEAADHRLVGGGLLESSQRDDLD